MNRMTRPVSPRTSWLALFLAALMAVVGVHVGVEAGSSGGYPGVLSGALSWAAGLGSSLVHITGPSDQPFVVQPGASQEMRLRSQGGVTKVTVSGTGALHAMGTGTASAYPGGVISINTGSQATTGTSEETLMSFSLPASTLDSNGRGVRITAWGTTAANGNTKVIGLNFGATEIKGVTVSSNNLTWRIEGLVFRTGAATQEAISGMTIGTTLSTAAIATPSETLSGAVTIALKAITATSAGDVTCQGLLVEVLP
jgi:hypothetical protein